MRIVANDSGGALTQILTARRPELVHSVVLTSCDAYNYFFPPLFRTLPIAARVPGALRGLAQALRLRWVRQLPVAYGWVTATPDARRDLESYLAADARVRRGAPGPGQGAAGRPRRATP